MWLNPLDFEIVWLSSMQMEESGLENADILSNLGFKPDKVNDVVGYLLDKIKVSDIPPLPSVVYDTAIDIRWAESPQ